MTVLTMPLDPAILAAKALLNHVSNDDTTPVITHAAVVEHEGAHFLVATDRYSFGRFILRDDDTFEHEGDWAPMIPREALQWVSKIVPKSLRRGSQSLVPSGEGGYAIRYTWTPVEDRLRGYELEVAILWGEKPERTQTWDVTGGNFPPVARLWRSDDAEPSPIDQLGLSVRELGKIVADVTLFETKHGAARMMLHGEKDKKPSPVQYTLGDGRWTAAVQPQILR